MKEKDFFQHVEDFLKDESQLQKYCDEMSKDIRAQMQVQVLIAKLIRAKFDALIKEGFSEEQALELARSIKL